MAVRYLYLIRHGQYDVNKESSTYGNLNELGHYQANCVAKRLSEYPITEIYSSTVVRAQQTTETIHSEFKNLPIKKNDLLREGLPYVPSNVIKQKKLDKIQIKLDKERMDKAFEIYFKPNNMLEDKHEAFVCHGNLIRYFICKCLGVPIEAWSNFEIFECSLSIIKIKEDGKKIVKSVGESGHIPLHKRTVI